MTANHIQAIRDVLNELKPKQKALPYLELDSMMLAQVVEVAKRVCQNDITANHVQNWVRREYIPHPLSKKYNREQVAIILLINDLRDVLSLEEISHLLGYVNENFLTPSEERINPTKLYRYYSTVFDSSQLDWQNSLLELEKDVEETLVAEKMPKEEKEKVANTLVILNLLARANLYKQIAKRWLDSLDK